MSDDTKAAIEEALTILLDELDIGPGGRSSMRPILEALVSKVTAEAEREAEALRLINALQEHTANQQGVVWRSDGPNGTQLCHNERAEAAEASARGLAEALRQIVHAYDVDGDCVRESHLILARAALSEWEAAEAGKGRRG